MSSTVLYAAPEGGTFGRIAEFRNSWGGAARVWSALCKRWLGDDCYWLTMRGDEQQAKVWALAKDERLSPAERIVMAATFDRVLVRRDELPRLAEHFREFDRLYPVSGVANHLPAQAALFDRLAGPDHGLDFVPFAVGWQQTTVSENPWWTRLGEDDGRPYDLSQDEGHWFLFDRSEITGPSIETLR